jgi:hypothetical protein
MKIFNLGECAAAFGAAALILGAASASQATVILTSGNQSGLTNIHGAGGHQTGNSVFGTVGTGGTGVTWSSSDTISTIGSGHAFIDGVGKKGEFDAISIYLTSYAYGFTDLNFNLQKPAKASNFNSQIKVYDLSNILIATFVMNITNGNNKGYLHGDAGEVFSKVEFLSGASGEFSSARQFDMKLAPTPVTGVPEPTTWALMISGFGLAGAALRRKRSTAAA